MEFSFASIINLYGRENVFEGITIPNGFDNELLINSIYDRCMFYQPIYIDMPLLNQAIKNFFSRHYGQMEKIDYLLNLKYKEDYNPIWNKDGSYKETESYSKTNKNSLNEQENVNDENINQVSAYDSSEFQNSDKSQGNQDRTNIKDQDLKEDFTHSFEHVEQGNIGVTTTMAMIKEEFEFHGEWFNDKYDWIATMFYDELFIHY